MTELAQQVADRAAALSLTADRLSSLEQCLTKWPEKASYSRIEIGNYRVWLNEEQTKRVYDMLEDERKALELELEVAGL